MLPCSILTTEATYCILNYEALLNLYSLHILPSMSGAITLTTLSAIDIELGFSDLSAQTSSLSVGHHGYG